MAESTAPIRNSTTPAKAAAQRRSDATAAAQAAAYVLGSGMSLTDAPTVPEPPC
jgi:hypothetical protein